MGVWGPGIFSDDLACDVRDGYRDLVADGLSDQQATDALLEEWQEGLADPEVAPIVWLALAATQWRCGRLEPRVQVRALEVINSGSDLHRWQVDAQLLRQRQAALAKLQRMLLSPQPARKRARKRFRDTCEWEIGEVIGYRLRSGRLVMFRVVGYHTDKGGTAPVTELLDWIGDDIPAQATLETCGIWTSGDHRQLMIGRVSERQLPRDRLLRLGVKLEPKQKPPLRYYYAAWKQLDAYLEHLFGIQ